ncbi:hypothetical protein Golax_011763 [Gossypium laxum]|uniref:RNase H type-1 domain-containing protein n=1 Tax=Gossypium laxum TaxID=34288 RepID=A0A7J8ZLJ6_9ROSI|nr:hypothetical protein [Gossypium laxum]
MRVAAMNSVWLREEGDGELQKMNQGQPNLWRNLRDRIKRESGMTINPILGFNLEGVMSSDFMNYREFLKGLGQMDMAHDLEESSIESADGKKRPPDKIKWYANGKVRRRCGFHNGIDVHAKRTVVADLIDDNSSVWKIDVVNNTFSESDANKILGIPLANEPYDDFMVWRGEASGEYSVWSYKLLLKVEVVACAQAVEMGLEMDLSTVEVEGDALSVFKKIQNNGVDKSKICAYIKDIQQLKKGFQICWFKHTLRMEDMVAHALATEGLNIFSFLF